MDQSVFTFIYATVIDPLLRGIRIYTPQFAGMKAGDRTLDVCCGTGDQAIHYAQKGIIATGIDLSPDMVRVAKRRKEKQGLSNVSFQIADAVNLPFKDNSFDYVSISLALHEKEMETRDKVISEMRRVARKGDTLIFIDYQIPLPPNQYARLGRAAEFIAGGEHYRCFKDYVKQGGLDELLPKNQIPEVKRDYLKHGLMVIIKARNT